MLYKLQQSSCIHQLLGRRVLKKAVLITSKAFSGFLRKQFYFGGHFCPRVNMGTKIVIILVTKIIQQTTIIRNYSLNCFFFWLCTKNISFNIIVLLSNMTRHVSYHQRLCVLSTHATCDIHEMSLSM